MSNTTTMPFQPGTMEDAPAPELDESPGKGRMLVILGAVAGLAVLAIAAYFLLFAGGSDKKPAAVVPPSTTVQPSTAPSTAPVTAVQPKISARNFGTDPFKALLSENNGATTTGTTTTGTTTPVTTPTTTPTTPAATTYKFKVLNVAASNESAKVSFNGGAPQTMKPGETVGGKFLAKRFQGGSCGTFKFGDEPPFDLCEGSTIKR
jgi:hypothetical protein